MRKLVVVFLFGTLAAGSAFAQSNTTAGLAGVGAGAALGGITGQSGTTPSGGGGGSTPIEIQIMVFNGLQKIAAEVAGITRVQLKGCIPSVDPNAEYKKLWRDIDKSDEDRKSPDQDPKKLAEDIRRIFADSKAIDNVTASQTQKYKDWNKQIEQSQNDLNDPDQNPSALAEDITALVSAMKKIDEENKNYCTILIEDPTSANQIALYQAVQGYYGHLQQLHNQLQENFSLQVGQSGFYFTVGATQQPLSLMVTNVGSRRRAIRNVAVTGTDANEFNVDIGTCKDPLDPQESCSLTVIFPVDDREYFRRPAQVIESA